MPPPQVAPGRGLRCRRRARVIAKRIAWVVAELAAAHIAAICWVVNTVLLTHLEEDCRVEKDEDTHPSGKVLKLTRRLGARLCGYNRPSFQLASSSVSVL